MGRRPLLLAALDEFGAVSLNDERLAIRRPKVPRDPEPLLGWMQQLAGYATNIARHLEATPERQGLYR